jgi:phage terminase Nu1 subunit (DNA packaging protein)
MNTATGGADAAVVARVLNLNVSSIHRLAKEAGFPPKLAPGVFDVQKVTLWYIRYLQAEARRRGPSGGVETAAILAERLRLLKAQSEKCERENAIERREYLRADAVMTVWTKCLTNCRSRLLALPTKLAVVLVNRSEPSYIAEQIKQEVYMALTELASGAAAADPSDTANSETDDDVPVADGDNP